MSKDVDGGTMRNERIRRPNVSVIGGFRANEDDRRLAHNLGGELMRRGYNIIEGGRKGVMESCAEGAQSARAATRDPGVVVGVLPESSSVNGNRFLDVALPTGMGYLRNGLVVSFGDAVVAIGGMGGTLSEISMAWQMDKPIAFLGSGGWSRFFGGTQLDERRPDALPVFKDTLSVMAWLDTVLTSGQNTPSANCDRKEEAV